MIKHTSQCCMQVPQHYDEVEQLNSRTKGTKLLEHFENVKVNVTGEQKWFEGVDVTVDLLMVLKTTSRKHINCHLSDSYSYWTG